jgi:diketogulonate reductase-like aldo/keto reductase
MCSFAGVSRKGSSASAQTLCSLAVTPQLTQRFRYSPLPKSSQPHRVKLNADLYDFSLTEEDMMAIDELDEGDNGALSWNPIYAQ